MLKYTTKQRQALLNYLSAHADERLSAREILSGIECDGISLSSVYRNLSVLEKEGMVKRYVKAGTRDAFYRYVAADLCADRLHLSCTVCGKTSHMQMANANMLINQIAQNEDFIIDKNNTILQGICKKCKNKAAKKEKPCQKESK